jgi:hypothetical protein
MLKGSDPLSCDLKEGWEQGGQVREYTADTLFDYMNGNAEGYLIYGFERMRGITCRKDEKRVLIDISEMSGPESAWGLYASNRDPREVEEDLGTAGQVLSSRAFFAKGRYLVELAMEPAGEDRETLMALASALEERIEGSKTLPAALAWFPTDGLKKESLRLVPQSPLGISALRKGYTAEYESGARAFIVEEISSEASEDVMATLRQRFEDVGPSEVTSNSFLARGRYLGEICVFQKGTCVAGVVKAASSEDAEAFGALFFARIP